MVVKIISEAIELQDDAPRESFVKRVVRMIRKRAMLLGAILFFGAGIAFAISALYPTGKPILPKRATVTLRPTAVMDKVDAKTDKSVQKMDTSARDQLPPIDVQPDKPIEKMDISARDQLPPIDVQPDKPIEKMDTSAREPLPPINDQIGGLPSTDRAPIAAAEQPRPWVLHGDGVGTIDSRNPEISKATEIYVGTDLSDAQVNKLANKIDEQVSPKLNELVARVDSRLEEKMAEIAARYELTAEELSSLKAELTRSLSVTLREEMARNEELWQNNATYRVLYHRSVDLNQDLIGLYAGKTKDDHAIGNVLKVVPKLFTLQVWQNRDNDDQYLRLLARYEELQSDGRQIEIRAEPQQQEQPKEP